MRQFVEERGRGGILNGLYWDNFDSSEILYDDIPDGFDGFVEK